MCPSVQYLVRRVREFVSVSLPSRPPFPDLSSGKVGSLFLHSWGLGLGERGQRCLVVRCAVNFNVAFLQHWDVWTRKVERGHSPPSPFPPRTSPGFSRLPCTHAIIPPSPPPSRCLPSRRRNPNSPVSHVSSPKNATNSFAPEAS